MRKNCRTIVMAYVNLQSGRIEFLAKSQPSNTDKKQTAEFLFISPEEREQFGLHSIEYFLNYCPVKFEKIRNYVILISNGFINGGWIWRMQNIVFV